MPPSDVVAVPVAGSSAAKGSAGGYGGPAGLMLLTRVTFASNCTSAVACDAAARTFAAQVNALLEAPIITMLNLKVGDAQALLCTAVMVRTLVIYGPLC